MVRGFTHERLIDIAEGHGSKAPSPKLMMKLRYATKNLGTRVIGHGEGFWPSFGQNFNGQNCDVQQNVRNSHDWSNSWTWPKS